MSELKVALEKIAEHNSLGGISDDLLSKACESYKIKSDEFNDSYEYHVCVTKSLYDHLNNIDPDAEICKAVIPGQTKTVDGVVYIYTATPGAKTQYDWRVFRAKGLGRGGDLDDAQVVAKNKYVNDLFPFDLSSLKTIKKLGGSTGAKLVEDSKGNQYVMKRGTNTTNEHVQSEFLANQIYDLLGQRVPDYELYDDNGTAVLLSKFIPLTTVPTASDYDEMVKGFAADALLANWDVYKNDNCLKDSAGRILRVDNGGTMAFRAQGTPKTFDAKLEDWDSIQKYNPVVVANLKPEDYIKQIDEVLKKKNDVVEFLKISGETALATTFEGRFKKLASIKSGYEAVLAKNNKKVAARKLQPDAIMYRPMDDNEMNEIWFNTSGNDYSSKILRKDNSGWELLGNICKSRGYDARPEVVSDGDYWNSVKNSPYQLFRGLAPDHKKAEDYADDFKYNDNCFYGSIGAHGSGIYFHVNDGTGNKDNDKNNYKNSDAYKAARGYATGSGVILDAVMHPQAKVAKLEDIKKEILSLVTFDKAKVDAKRLEIDDLQSDLKKQEDDLQNITKVTTDAVKANMHWDNDTLVMHQIEIDNIDWGLLDADGNPDYPSFDNFFHGKMENWVKKNGGTIEEKGAKGSDVYILRLPNSNESFMFSRYQYENNAIKRKNAFAVAYNYPVKRFQNWLMNEHYKVINNAVEKEVKNIGDKVVVIQKDINKTKANLTVLENEMKDLKKTKNPDANLLSGIYESVSHGDREAIGTYAALKGYDAMIHAHGNGGRHSFMIVFNRSKIIVKK